jgi:hypothetical protein
MSYYRVNIFASFLPQAIVDPQQQLGGYNNLDYYFNLTPSSQTCIVSAHPLGDITNIGISSNGIDEFIIFPIKFVGERVNFVVKLKDSQNYDVKDYPLLSLNDLTLSLSSADGGYIDNVGFSANFGTLSSLNEGGFFKGVFYSPVTASNISIKAVYTDANLDLTGYSTNFSIYLSSYDIRKVNEDFNQADAFKSLAYQPVLYDRPGFFDQFLGQIVGNNNSDPNNLGIEVYEKISNYVSNIDDVEYCNVDSLKALFDNLEIDYQNFDLSYPASLKRLIDILSVKHKRLFGQTNQYQGNFDDKGFINSTKYGLNKGNEIDIETGKINPNSGPSYVITYEKFSGIYNTVLKTFSAGVTDIYDLSSVNNSWGWNLVVPNGVSGVAVKDYYSFYEFVSGTQGSLLQKFIDFDNPNNTLTITNSSYNEYVKVGGIIDSVISYNLLSNLQLLTSA